MALQSRVRRYAMYWLRRTQRSRALRDKENKESVPSSLQYHIASKNVSVNTLSKHKSIYDTPKDTRTKW